MGYDNPAFTGFMQSSPQIFNAPQAAMKSAQDIRANEQKISSADLQLQLQQALQPIAMRVEPLKLLSQLPASKTSFTTDPNGGIKLIEKAPPAEMVRGQSSVGSPAANPVQPSAQPVMGPQPMAPQGPVQPIILNPAAGAAMMGGMNLDDMVATIMQTGQLPNSSFITAPDQKVQDALASGATQYARAKVMGGQKGDTAVEKARLAADQAADMLRRQAAVQLSKGPAGLGDEEARALILKQLAKDIVASYKSRGFDTTVDDQGNTLSEPRQIRQIKTSVPKGANVRNK